MKKIIQKSLSILFLVLFAFTFLNAVLSMSIYSYNKFGFCYIYFIIFIIAFILLLCSAAVFTYLKKLFGRRGKLKAVPIEIIYAVLSALVLIAQLVFVFKLRYIPRNDAMYVDTAARNFAVDGSYMNMIAGIENKKYYFAHFPNNWGILIFLSFFYRIIFLLSGEIPAISIQILNILLIQIACLFMFLTSKLIFNDKPRQLFSAMFAAVLPVFYLYSPIFYTDTLSMPFVMSSVYCFLRGVKSGRVRSRVLWTLLSSLLVGVGYTFKGSLCVIMVALIMYGFMKKPPLKALLSAVSLVAVLLVCNSLVYNFGLSLGISTPEKQDRHQLPASHWIMMSLVGNGGFDHEEFRYTLSQKSYDEKNKADIERIKQHFSDYTPRGFLDHLVEKSAFTWNSGEYYAIHHLEESENTSLFGFLKSSGYFRSYCDSIHLLMLLLMLVSFIGGTMQKHISPVFLIRLSIFGLALFLLIWETRSRYLVNFIPLFMLLSADGIRYLCALLSKLKISLVKNKA